MQTNKNIIDIINIQNSCKHVIQELYTYESRPNDTIRATSKYAKIDEALRLDILEYDSFDDELSLSSDTEEYYKTRLGQNSDTYIGLIGDKIAKLKVQFHNYNVRVKNLESGSREIKAIYKILNQIPSILKYNLHAISSNSIFAFKNEVNFDIKMSKLSLCQNEINELIEASLSIDSLLDEHYNFFKSMQSQKINATVLKLRHNSASIESSFRKLYEDIKNFINQSIKDGEFIKKLQFLKQLKDENSLYKKTNISELITEKKLITSNIKERRIHPDDRAFDYMQTISKIINAREIELEDSKKEEPLKYDLEQKTELEKRVYNYHILNKKFLAQEQDLISFLLTCKIEKKRILGVFIRLLKNYSHKYFIQENSFIKVENREFIKVSPNNIKVIDAH